MLANRLVSTVAVFSTYARAVVWIWYFVAGKGVATYTDWQSVSITVA